jgi:hypothetical protein
MVNPGSCIECGTPVPTLRCAPCQRRHNDRLQAEHEVMVRAMFRAAEGHTLGRSAKSRARTERMRRVQTSTDATASG